MAEYLLNIILIAQESTSLRLKRTLSTALEQTYEPKTVWVVNANPSDSAFTLGLLEDLKPYPQVTLLAVAGEGTEFYFRNKALERVNGDFVAFMSDTDVWEPDKAQRQIAQMLDNPQAGAAFANALVLRDTKHGIVGSAVTEEVTANPQAWMLEKTVSYGSQVMYRTDALRLIGNFDEQLHLYGDLDALVRMTEMRKVLLSAEMPVKVHIPPLEDLRREEFTDNRYLLSKHMDFFLVHKRTAFDFCLMLARQALKNREWLLMIAYIVRAVLKQPLRALLLLIRQTAGRLGTLVHNGFRGLYIAGAVLRLRTRLRAGAQPRTPKPVKPNRSRRKKSAALDQLREYEFVRLSSMKFMRNQNLEYVKIPNYVTVIPRGMFFGCKNLHTVEIPATVTRIEANAFQGCERLKSVHFAYESALESIGAYAFAGCVSLSEVQLSGSLMALGHGTFAGCTNLHDISFASLRDEEGASAVGFPSSLRTLPRFVFAGCSSLGQVKFESGSMLEKLERGAFFRCSSLETIRITGTVHTVASLAFAGCVQLIFLDIQAIDMIRVIGHRAFENCKSLQNLYVPHALTRINAASFRGCVSLKRVKIPQGIKRIGRQAFAGCTQLQSVILMDETTFYWRSSFPRQTKIAPYKQTDDTPAGRSV